MFSFVPIALTIFRAWFTEYNVY